MNCDKIRISLPIIVEGKYDKNTLLQIFDATVITLGGFGVFNSKEKQCLLRKISEKGVILLTDSDGAGGVIRSFVKGIIPKEKIYNLYIPKVEGKEKRKTKASKEGLLGVEGMGREELARVLKPFTVLADGAAPNAKKQGEMITKVDFYADKLTGFENSSLLREQLCRLAELPTDLTPNALLEAMNLLYGYEGYKEFIEKIKQQ